MNKLVRDTGTRIRLLLTGASFSQGYPSSDTFGSRHFGIGWRVPAAEVRITTADPHFTAVVTDTAMMLWPPLATQQQIVIVARAGMPLRNLLDVDPSLGKLLGLYLDEIERLWNGTIRLPLEESYPDSCRSPK